MTHPLELVADDAQVAYSALRSALSGGPAIMIAPAAAVAATAAPALPREVPRRVALVVETSGSSGVPKRVALSADALLASAAASESALGPGQWLLALPTHYIAGINVLVRSLSAELDPVFLGPGAFDPAAFADAAATMSNPVRFTSLVPAQLARVLDHPGAVAASRRFERILVGGQATPPALLARATEAGLRITRTYGASETGGGCVYDGHPLGSTVVRVAGGQLELAGPTLAEGYLGDPERTARAFHHEGGTRWYRTGDTGEVEGGVLRVTGRLDDVIVSGGIKVSLAAVERLVQSLPGLADAVVVSRPDEQWGEVPVIVTAAAAAHDDAPLGHASLQQVRDRIGKALGAAARPAAIVVVDELPLLASGKPDRAALASR